MSESITNDLNRVMDSTSRLNASYNDFDKPQKHTVDILSDDLPTPSAPNSIDSDFAQLDSPVGVPKGGIGTQPQSAERPLPQPPAQQVNGMTAEELADWRQERAERQKAQRVEVVQAQIAQTFITANPDFKPTPANAALVAETMRAHNLPMTVANMKAAWDAVRFMADDKPLDKHTLEEMKAADNIEFPAPPDELLQPSPAPTPQPQVTQPHNMPPCRECGAAYEAHVNGQCPSRQTENFSYGLSERPAPQAPAQLDLSNPADLQRIRDEMASLPIEQARELFVRYANLAKQSR